MVPPRGSGIAYLTNIFRFNDRDDYVAKAIEARLHESDKQMEWIASGFHHVLMQKDILKIFTWEEIEKKVCGSKEVTVDQLKAITGFVSACSQTFVEWQSQRSLQKDVVGRDGGNL